MVLRGYIIWTGWFISSILNPRAAILFPSSKSSEWKFTIASKPWIEAR